jgi:hypothetical protein
VPLISGFALRARLISILPLVFIAGPANRKSANVAGNEWFTNYSLPNIITADLADMSTQVLCGLPLGYHIKRYNIQQNRDADLNQSTQ